jgi:hypothetical protein
VPKKGGALEQCDSMGFWGLTNLQQPHSANPTIFGIDHPRLDMSLSSFKIHTICG